MNERLVELKFTFYLFFAAEPTVILLAVHNVSKSFGSLLLIFAQIILGCGK